MLKEVAPPPACYRLVPPLDLLRSLATRFPFQSGSPQFFTIAYVMIDVRTGETVVASAGHPGPLVLHTEGGCTSHDLASNAIGMFDEPDCEFAELRLTLRPGDRLVIYSDGVSEGLNSTGEMFGESRIAAAIEHARHLPLEGALDALLVEQTVFTGNRAPSDDISLLAIERTS